MRDNYSRILLRVQVPSFPNQRRARRGNQLAITVTRHRDNDLKDSGLAL